MSTPNKKERIQPITDSTIKKLKEKIDETLSKKADSILVLSRTNKKIDIAHIGTRTQIASSIIEYLEAHPDISTSIELIKSVRDNRLKNTLS